MPGQSAGKGGWAKTVTDNMMDNSRSSFFIIKVLPKITDLHTMNILFFLSGVFISFLKQVNN